MSIEAIGVGTLNTVKCNMSEGKLTGGREHEEETAGVVDVGIVMEVR